MCPRSMIEVPVSTSFPSTSKPYGNICGAAAPRTPNVVRRSGPVVVRPCPPPFYIMLILRTGLCCPVSAHAGGRTSTSLSDPRPLSAHVAKLTLCKLRSDGNDFDLPPQAPPSKAGCQRNRPANRWHFVGALGCHAG